MKTRWFELLQSPEPGSEGGGGAGAGAGGAGAGAGGADSTAGGNGEVEGELDDIARLKIALNKEREGNRDKDRRMSALEAQLRELNTTNPEAVRAAEAKALEEQTRRELIEQQARIAQEQIEAKYSTQLVQMRTELDAEREASQRQLVKREAEKTFAKAKGSFEVSEIDGTTGFDSVWDRFGPNCRIEDGALVIVDNKGNPEIDTETGRRFDPVKWFERLRPDPVYGRHFEPSMGSGGGARSSRDGRASSSKDLMGVPLSTAIADVFS